MRYHYKVDLLYSFQKEQTIHLPDIQLITLIMSQIPIYIVVALILSNISN